MLCGLLYFVEQWYLFFRLRELEIIPQSVLSDTMIWEAVPASADTFWFSLMFKEREFLKKLEGFYPVEVKLRIIGWGRYRVSVTRLKPYLYVSWNSKMWLLSANGRMWLANLPSNAKVKGLSLPDKPVLVWDKGLAIPIDPDRQNGEIYPSSLPLAKITGWYEALEKTGWEKEAYCLIAKKIDGRPVVQILMGSESDVFGEVIVKEDTADWFSLASALEELFPNAAHKIPPGFVINATFADMKFTVTSKDKK